MLNSIWWFFCGDYPSEEDSKEETNLESVLKNISSEVALRSDLHQLDSLSKDKTNEKTYNILKTLVKQHRFTVVSQLKTLCIGLNIWLYSVPVPPGSVSINPSTKFQCRRVLRVFLGKKSDWEEFKKNASPDVAYDLEDTAFEEKE
jgi:hypothetical protein